MDQCFQPAKVLHPFCHSATDETDMIPFLEIQLRLSINRRDEYRRDERRARNEYTKLPLHSGHSSGWFGKNQSVIREIESD
jgi:hypothetical protein